jgi:hypothetical protein
LIAVIAHQVPVLLAVGMVVAAEPLGWSALGLPVPLIATVGSLFVSLAWPSTCLIAFVEYQVRRNTPATRVESATDSHVSRPWLVWEHRYSELLYLVAGVVWLAAWWWSPLLLGLISMAVRSGCCLMEISHHRHQGSCPICRGGGGGHHDDVPAGRPDPVLVGVRS